ncbi:TonB-dependent siderophore receptor [Thioalkalivibrio sp. ALJ7]|uniref:TonB-dependent receptor n=1 Tax=Thioalkalivibrio sp. ALJ7 TaxID=1158756 RepID=UPI001E2A0004|nr:TonB-dependent siderophore receptor [Thioalkalivibrio sp. ALJ7]
MARKNAVGRSGAVSQGSASGAGVWQRRAIVLAILGMAGAPVAHADEPEETGAAELDPVLIDFRGERMSSPKYSRDLQDTPRIITILSSDLLEEQNVTELRDAMRNVSGISLQAGEGNPPGGDQLKIRGFNARDDINVDGFRDLGNYFRDPFYVDQIEVIKGPNSAFSGRGSAGGTINFVTKKPMLEDRNRIETSVGTDSYFRSTGDFNKVIDDNSAFRINLMTHSQDVPGRDVVDQRRHGFFGAYTWGFQSDTMVEVNYLHTRQNNTPDQGIPLDREGFSGDTSELTENNNSRTPGGQRAGDGYYTGKLPPGLDYSNYYGHTDDHQKIDVDQIGVVVDHMFSDQVSWRNQVRYSRVSNDSITSSPRIKIPEDVWGSGDWDAAEVQGDLKPRDQRDESIFVQSDLLLNFDTGPLTHDLVLGTEFGYVDIENRRRPDVSGPRTDLYNPSRRTRPNVPYDGTRHRLESEQAAVYALNTIALSPQWDLHGGLRYDHVKSTATDYGWDDPIGPISRTDREWSYNLGVVYKPVPEGSIYASYGNSFDVTGTFDRGLVQLAGGGTGQPRGEDIVDLDAFDTDPEETRAFEIGTKWQVLDGLSVNAAVFQTEKTNARTPAQGGGDLLDVLEGRQRIRGFELNAVGRLTPEWNLYGSYTYLGEAKVLRSNNPWEEGERLGGTPKNSLALYTTYDITPRWTVGGGLEYVSGQVNNVPNEPGSRRRQVEIDSYTIFNASASYRITNNAQIRMNVYNLTDEDYISQLAEGGAQGIPGAGRQAIATFRYDF